MSELLLRAAVGAFTLTLLYGFVRLWFHAIVRLGRGQPIVPFQARRPVPWGFLDLLLILVLVFLTVQLSQLAAMQWGDIALTDDVESLSTKQFAFLLLSGSLATLATCVASLVLVQFRAGATRKDLGVVFAEVLSDVRLGFAAFVMLAPPMYLLQVALTQLWKYEHPVQDLLERQTDVTMLLVTLVAAVVVAPFAEEMFFRVLLQGWLENGSALARKSLWLIFGIRFVDSDDLQRDWRAIMLGDNTGEAFGLAPPSIDQPIEATLAPVPAEIALPPSPSNSDANPYASPRTDAAIVPAAAEAEPPTPAANFRPGYVPIALSAAIFALMHLGQGPAPIPLFFLAIGLGYIYRQTHRATPSIVVHFLINALSMTLLWISLVFKE